MKSQPLCYIIASGMGSAHGTEMHTALMAAELRKNGYRTVLYTAHFNANRSEWTSYLKKNEVCVRHPGFWFMTRRHWPLRMIAWRMLRDARRERPQLIWAPENNETICYAVARNKEEFPFFVHDNCEAGPVHPYYPSLWFKVCNQITGLTVHGQRQKKSAIFYYKMTKPVSVVWPSSFPPKQVAPLNPIGKKIRFGQFGRLYSMKGSVFAVAAFAQCVATGADAELHFFGDGPFKAPTEELARSLGLREKVFFHGGYHWDQLDELVAQIDVGLMPSIYEGFGLVMLELMSRGRPVIATDVGSSREVLENLGGGWVVPRANTAELAKALTLCANASEIVRQKGAEARAVWQQHFTPEQMYRRYAEFWRECGVPANEGQRIKPLSA